MAGFDDLAAAMVQADGGESGNEPIKREDENNINVGNETDDDQLNINSEGDESQQLSTNNEGDDEITWGKALGIDDKMLALDEEGNIKGIVTNVNGEVQTVSLQDLVAGYQLNKNVTSKSQALAEERKQFEQVKSQVAQEYSSRIETLDLMLNFMGNKILGDAKAIDWERLRVENPGEYAAKVQDFNLRKQELANIFSAAEQEKARLQQEAEGQQNERRKAFYEEQADLLIQNNPEWRDPVKMQAAFSEMSSFALETYGFKPEEFNSVADARIFNLLQDAMKYRKGVQVASNKIKGDIPKFIKPTGKSNKVNSRLQTLTERAKKATGAAKRHAETDAIAELLLMGDK